MNIDQRASAPAAAGTRPTDIYFFATCLVDQFAPEAGLDAIRLIEREGIRVHFPPDQTCCGQPAYSSGFEDEARAVARRQLDIFPEPWPVVVPSGSCAAMMRHHYPPLFADDPVLAARAGELAGRIFELTDFLANVIGFCRPDQGEACTVVLHTSCHARREMGSHLSSRALLDGLGNVRVATQTREDECCGFGGTFSVRHPTISQAMVEEKLATLVATGASRVVSADCGCLMNILGHAEYRDKAEGKAQPTLPGEHIASFLLRRTAGEQA
ncbi:MAG: (Fe-S)-binding protein [Rhodocyclaceae bacterium]|nr:(Fe-S)-binding protein [Rhodocyclaceae bacterium]